MSPVPLTRDLAFAASLDEGNRSMGAAHRQTWNDEDQAAFMRSFNRLWPQFKHAIEPEDFCPYCDQDEIPAGHPLSTKTPPT